MGTNKPLRNMPIIHISTFWDWKKTITKTQQIQHLCLFWSCTASWDAICVSICSKHIPSTLGVNRSVSTHIWLLWDVFFIFIGAFGSEFAPICDWLWEQLDFLVFDDFDDVVVFSRAGCGWQKLFRAYCGYNGCTLEHFQSILMPLGRFGGLWRG